MYVDRCRIVKSWLGRFFGGKPPWWLVTGKKGGSHPPRILLIEAGILFLGRIVVSHLGRP